MKLYKLLTFAIALPLMGLEEKRISVVVPSYNNALYIEKNLDSIVGQDYSNFQIVYVNDASTDGTGKLAQQILSKSNIQHTVINHKENRKAAFSRWHGIQLCGDDDIIVLVDGDDALAHKDVLKKINEVYQSADVWLTYGSYQTFSGKLPTVDYKIPKQIFRTNGFRSHGFVSTHLRTFYAWLYKEMPLKKLLTDNRFVSAATDATEGYCLLEMANKKVRHIEDILYLYNDENNLSISRVNSSLQKKMAHQLISKAYRLKPLKSRPTKKGCCVALWNKSLTRPQLIKLLRSADFVIFEPREVDSAILDKLNQTKAIAFLPNQQADERSIPVQLSNEDKPFCVKHLSHRTLFKIEGSGIYDSKFILANLGKFKSADLVGQEIYVADEIILHD